MCVTLAPFDVISLSLSPSLPPSLLVALNCSAGTSYACCFNRLNDYILLTIMMWVRFERFGFVHFWLPLLVLRRNLCGLTYCLYLTLDRDSAFADSRQGLIDKFCAFFPLALVVLAYLFDSDENMDSKVDNGILNVARHSCNCFFSPCFSTPHLLKSCFRFSFFWLVPSSKSNAACGSLQWR